MALAQALRRGGALARAVSSSARPLAGQISAAGVGPRLLPRSIGSSIVRIAQRLPIADASAAPSRALCDLAAVPIGEVSDEPAVRGASFSAFLAWESPEYARFINMIMKDGKKETARKVLWRAFMRLRDGGHDPQEVFYSALDNVRPMMEMRTFKSGPVPFPLNPRRAEGQAMKWIVGAARKRTGQSLDKSLANELLAAHQYKGSAIQKKEEVHKTAVANQAAAHFRWRVGSSSVPGAIDMGRKEHRPRGRRVIKRLQGAMSDEPLPRPRAERRESSADVY